tara:strand:+ start:4007 stop:4360 length:354 start_codon:yes stop_codon:yes gene_type:complete
MKIGVKHGLGIFAIFIVAFVFFDNNRRGAINRPNPKVYNNTRDNSVFQVENYIKKYSNDPDSYESIEWYKVVNNTDGTFSVRHIYRGRNVFGAYHVFDHVFYLDQNGQVVDYESMAR